jgi:hypothetical protein
MARDLRLRATPAELNMVRFVLHELARQLDIACAEAEEELGKKRKSRARDQAGDGRSAKGRHGGPSSTPSETAFTASVPDRSSESAATGMSTEGFMSSAELQQRLGVKRQALSVAVKAGRLFAIVGPSGDKFYPSYYADPSLDRRVLEKVSKALGTLPAAAKHRFFTTHSAALRGSALEALRNGRVADVMAVAQAFVPR